jgi:hypothetical protein
MTSGGDGGSDLAVSASALAPIGEDAAELRTGLAEKALAAADSSGLAAPALSAAGLETGAALTRTVERFGVKTRTLADRCAHIEQHLTGTVTSHAALEDDIENRLRGAATVVHPVLGSLDPAHAARWGLTPPDATGPAPVRPL